MKRFKTVVLFLVSVLVFIVAKKLLINVSYESDVLSIILTITSLLFSLLASYFINELWERYTLVRQLQAEWSAGILSLINYAKLFGTKKFKKDFFSFLKKYLYLVVLNDWEKLDREIKYFHSGAELFNQILNRKNFEIYINEFIRTYDSVIEKLSTLSILGKEKLTSSEWFILYLLSSMIFFTSVFIRSENFLFSLFSYLFPFIVILILLLLNSLNNLSTNMEIVTYGPIEDCFDALNLPRFYLKRDLKYISKDRLENYVTEEDIKGEINLLIKDLEEKGIDHNFS